LICSRAVATFASPAIEGWAEAQVGGTDICVYFEEDGAGGWQMRVEVGDDEFIV
jgi:hypothetical protein